jgi:cell wall-associated NlpC family hydrolase
MKRLAIFGSALIALMGCASSAAVAETSTIVSTIKQPMVKSFYSKVQDQAIRNKLEKMVAKLETRIGKTRYVFSGSSPAGWDCSGMVRWAYGQIGIDLPHSANKQGHLGVVVKKPLIGDVVVFGWKGSKSFYHSAIYVGNNQVIHAGFRRGSSTEKIALNSRAFAGSTIRFVQIVDQP